MRAIEFKIVFDEMTHACYYSITHLTQEGRIKETIRNFNSYLRFLKLALTVNSNTKLHDIYYIIELSFFPHISITFVIAEVTFVLFW